MVRSFSAGKGRYLIEMGDTPHCYCAYHETHGSTCKHIFAGRGNRSHLGPPRSLPS
jgi:hypothetical protein